MIEKLLKKIEEAKDTDFDYNKEFQVAVLPKEKAIVVKQLFNYVTKYPIYIKVEEEDIAKSLEKITDYDIDVYDVNLDVQKDYIAVVLFVNIDSKDIEKALDLRLILDGDNERVEKV